MIADFFIARPVLANVLAILIMVIGGVALFKLPVAQYPDVVPPTVQVTTRYPGASARAVIDSVALPIEQQVNGVDGMQDLRIPNSGEGSITLDARRFVLLPAEIGIRLLGRAIARLGYEGALRLGQVEALYAAIVDAKQGSLRRTLAGALVTLRSAKLVVARAPRRRSTRIVARP